MNTPPPAIEAPVVPPRPDKLAPPPPPKKRPPFRLFGGFIRSLFILAAVLALGGAVAAYGLYRSLEAGLPDYRWLADYSPPQMSRIYAGDSRLMAELAAERRVFVPIEAIPRRLQQAFISAEDQNFESHHGVDPAAVIRAIITNIEQYGTGRRMVGASTITQQVAKNMLVGSDRTVLRKAREALLAIRLENALPKSRILEIYLNEIFLGAQAYGVAAAAQAYFNKSLEELSLSEMAFLAALPKAPNNYNPLRFPEQARIRRNWVLERMVDDRVITAEEAATARAETILARPFRRPEVVPVGGHFTEDVRRELISRFGQEQTQGGGLVVRTSLDPALQAATEVALRNGLLAFDRRRGGWRGPLAKSAHGATEWLPALEAFGRPPGMLPEWRQAVVIELRERDARVGWFERANPRAPAEPRTGTILLEDLAWARPVLPSQGIQPVRLGNPPRRMSDVLALGDVVMVEPAPAAAPAAGATPPRNAPAPRADRVLLRQIPDVEGAVVALDPNTGRVLAMAGGWSFERSQFNRASQALRQPGSSFKPYVYISALEQGIPPNQRFLDGGVEIATPQGVWRPGNYGGGSSGGYVTMRNALERSLNLVTVRIAQEVGMDRVSETAARFGVIENMPRFLSMSLGAGETTVLRQAAAYASFVNGGKRVEPTLIDSVQDQRGRVIWRSSNRDCAGCSSGPEGGPPRFTDNRRQIADPIAAFQITSILQGAVQRGTGARAGAGLNRPVAGKTGTTDDYKDNWFVGFTPDIVIAVWVGYDDPRSLGQGETGGTNAAPIFREVLAAALQGSPAVPFRAPPGVALVRIQTDRGETILEAFRPGTENSATMPTEMGSGAAARVDSGLGGLY
ncbi:PBP1A family penicillin-binding protein [Roseococcus sp. SDR]|uniref:penicillin-binding protein 1A n=1 Tax=Roseococcus sp. SDR TaxID=2835532 RepID=UPI001BCEB28D|nr:PBP1A family penicillin-binding protein [Roseococcus sp. SDR]MBS7790373.1 PBP1A family penicillin-binding protein [Roseococcus sp. SDR]MBV1845687.1 PBP1A family penicillin-binding protein [Roseococcus sp. SDR]